MGAITPQKKPQRFYQNRPNLEQRWNRCRGLTRAARHKSHVGGERGSSAFRTHPARTLSLLTYAELAQAFIRSCSSGGAPAMNPSSLGFSRQSNLSTRHCVGIPQVWVLPTQDSQTAPEKEDRKAPEWLLCAATLQSTVKSVCREVLSASCSASSPL